MLTRRNKNKFTKNCHKGPGKISVSMGINHEFNGVSLISDQIWIEDQGKIIKENEIIVTKRVGIDYAEEDANLPYRFLLK